MPADRSTYLCAPSLTSPNEPLEIGTYMDKYIETAGHQGRPKWARESFPIVASPSRPGDSTLGEHVNSEFIGIRNKIVRL